MIIADHHHREAGLFRLPQGLIVGDAEERQTVHDFGAGKTGKTPARRFGGFANKYQHAAQGRNPLFDTGQKGHIHTAQWLSAIEQDQSHPLDGPALPLKSAPGQLAGRVIGNITEAAGHLLDAQAGSFRYAGMVIQSQGDRGQVDSARLGNRLFTVGFRVQNYPATI
jgi:hypothetical protein